MRRTKFTQTHLLAMKAKFLAVEFILKVRNKVFLPCPPPPERISAAIPKTESDMSGGAKGFNGSATYRYD